MSWLARVATVASLSVGFAQALSYLIPAVNAGWPRVFAITLPLLGLTVINLVGVRSGANTAVLLIFGKLIPLGLYVVVGIFAVSLSTVFSQQATEEGGLAGAVLILIFAYGGFENTAAAAGEYTNPKKDIPFALLVEIGIVTLLYLAVQWIALGTVPGLGSSATPLADGARIFLGGWGGLLLTVGAAISILGTKHNSVLAGPRYLFALARDGYGPKFLASIHPRFRTPANAILVQTCIALPLALSGTFVGLATLSVIARLFSYLGTTAAIPVLRRTFPATDGFRLPGGILVPVAATVVGLGMLASTSRANLLAGAAAAAVGGVIYALKRPGSRTEV
jgi:amino acid transporter